MMMESSLGDMLLKVLMFALVQALVYIILSHSSNIFSNTVKRSSSFKPARSVSIRRMLAALQDLPAASEPSPKTCSPSVQQHSTDQDQYS
ncbi:uncharacterized protein LOC126667391 [Mercurialis annua]|uniref:uncharacterized protein LOC126667391 n=1 Tax=Mercurialis annua TaxID=3986 RepID=UPI00215E4C5F|nr:uncharacterized protein LOC126667391 [Mercurialis annua]